MIFSSSYICSADCFFYYSIHFVRIVALYHSMHLYRVVLVESEFDPLESIKKKEPEIHDATFKAT